LRRADGGVLIGISAIVGSHALGGSVDAQTMHKLATRFQREGLLSDQVGASQLPVDLFAALESLIQRLRVVLDEYPTEPT
jgi:hypothetical protein